MQKHLFPFQPINAQTEGFRTIANVRGRPTSQAAETRSDKMAVPRKLRYENSGAMGSICLYFIAFVADGKDPS